MGVQGLWQLLEPAAQTCTLNDISLLNGYSATKKGNILRIGVDISVVLNECIAAEHTSHLYQHKISGELRIFLFKLCKFLREAPVIMIFVFDGPNRPSFKHGRRIDTHTIPDWSNLCKTIIEAFGFYWHQAPGEAEAELAMLSRYNAIDAVMTSDSDTFVFGAQCVIKQGSADQYLLYSMDVVENTVGLSRGGLLLIALLSKSDYSDGLAGCSPSISASLARCGFGDRILRAVTKLEDFKLRRELDSIAVDIRAELQNNSSGLLNSRYPMLASTFSIDTIASEKILAFLYPIVSTGSPLPSSSLLPPNIPTWIAKEPSIPRIGRFCTQTLNWAPNALEKKLANILWPGVFLRMLTSPLLLYSDANERCLTPHTQTKISKVNICSRQNRAGKWGRIQYSAENFAGLLGVNEDRVTRAKMKAWVSAEYLPAEFFSMPVINSSPLASPHASTSAQVAAVPEPTIIGESSDMPNSDLLSIGESSESPDPPSIRDLLDSISLPTNETNAQNSIEVLEITDSSKGDSDVEIIQPPHKRMRLFSPEVIVISD